MKVKIKKAIVIMQVQGFQSLFGSLGGSFAFLGAPGSVLPAASVAASSSNDADAMFSSLDSVSSSDGSSSGGEGSMSSNSSSPSSSPPSLDSPFFRSDVAPQDSPLGEILIDVTPLIKRLGTTALFECNLEERETYSKAKLGKRIKDFHSQNLPCLLAVADPKNADRYQVYDGIGFATDNPIIDPNTQHNIERVAYYLLLRERETSLITPIFIQTVDPGAENHIVGALRGALDIKNDGKPSRIAKRCLAAYAAINASTLDADTRNKLEGVFLTFAAQQGDTLAHHFLSRHLEYTDLAGSQRHRQLGDTGPKLAYRMAHYKKYSRGLIRTKQLNEEAASLFKIGAEAGIPEAQTEYGICLQEGLGVQKSEKEAAKKLAITLFQRAIANLSEILQRETQSMNEEAKMVHYATSQSGRHARKARYSLGWSFLRGIGVGINEGLAAEQFAEGMKFNCKKSVFSLAEICQAAADSFQLQGKLHEAGKQTESAIQGFRKAAEFGHPEGLRRAAALQDPESQFELGRQLYEKKETHNEGYELIQRASARGFQKATAYLEHIKNPKK